MNAKGNPLGGINEGYGSRNKWNLKRKEVKRFTQYGGEERKYPDGIIPAVTLTIAVVITLGLALGLTPKGYSNKEHLVFLYHQWYNIIWYILGAAMCFIGLWAIGRTGMFATTRYGMMKFSRLIKLDALRQKVSRHDYAIDHVSNLQEYEDFLKVRKKETKKVFFITWVTYLSTFVAWTIVMSVLNATLNH
ncbi:hypothetical protein [Ureaplasma ceti]|uniref:DUF3899 domain-containing protein n=1 Tax=Ureaplasma ceti TaxID=3119530 RepID=A0ABP9U6S8_9BACT